MDIKNRITGEVYFVTDTVVDWVDIFTRPIYRHIIIESLQYCQKEKGLIIYAWVLMTNHLHAIVGSSSENKVSDTIYRNNSLFSSSMVFITALSDLKFRWFLLRSLLMAFRWSGNNFRNE